MFANGHDDCPAALDLGDFDRWEKIDRLCRWYKVNNDPTDYATLSRLSDDDIDALFLRANGGIPYRRPEPPTTDGRSSTVGAIAANDDRSAHKSNGKGRAIKTGDGYFVKSPLDAAVDPAISHRDYRLLSLLIILSGDKGYSWWPIERLADEMPGPSGRKGVSHDTIERGIAALVNAGYVSIVRPDQLASHGYKHHTSSNTYILNLGLR